MSSASGPSIATSGLVLDFDMNNTQKSWLGKPTTNYVDPKWVSWGIDGSGQATLGTRTILSIYDCIITDEVSNTRQSIFVLGLSASTAYTFSVKFKKISGAPTLRFQLQSYNGATALASVFPTTIQIGLTDIDGWQTASYTYTTAVGTDRVLWFMQDGNDYTTYTHSFELKEPQAELGSFATPFIEGTRSTTQAIVDLTGNNTLTATSLTYASDNTFSFNGSNYATVTGLGYASQYSIQMFVKVANNPGSYKGFCGANDGVGNDYQIGFNIDMINLSTSAVDAIAIEGAGISNGNHMNTSIPFNQWFNLCVVISSSTSTLYINGIQQQSKARTSTPDAAINFMTIGARPVTGTGNAGSYASTSSIATYKFYKRALSADEVKQNFNALRGRFGI